MVFTKRKTVCNVFESEKKITLQNSFFYNENIDISLMETFLEEKKRTSTEVLVKSTSIPNMIRYLKNSVDNIVTMFDILDTLRNTSPSIHWHVECYHYETRTRLVTYTDSNGNTQTRTETYQEVVVTHVANTNYIFQSWEDASRDYTGLVFSIFFAKTLKHTTLGLDEYALTKLTCHKTFTFANDYTQQDYYAKQAKFKAENDLDVFQSFSEELVIPGFEDKYLAEIEKGMAPSCLNSLMFYLFSALFLSPAYRMWMSSIVGRKEYTVVKQISI